MNIQLEIKAMEVEDLKIFISEKEKEIENLRSIIQKKDMLIKYKDQQIKDCISEFGRLEYTLQNIEILEKFLKEYKNHMRESVIKALTEKRK